MSRTIAEDYLLPRRVRLRFHYVPEYETQGRIHTVTLYEGPMENQAITLPAGQAIDISLRFFDERLNT
jgi:hypothetical protein